MTTSAAVFSPCGYASRRFAASAPVASPLARSTPARPLRPLWLDRGNVVRIESGQGTLVHVHCGVVWVTEEASRRDDFLVRGQQHRVANDGLTILHADRDSRIVLEFASGRMPQSVEVGSAAGEPGRAVPLPTADGDTTLTSLIANVRSLARAVEAWWKAPSEDDRHVEWSREHGQWNERDHTPEAVRARIFRASAFAS